MTPAEQGFLLLTSTLGNPERRPLTVAQFRTLADRVCYMEAPKENRQLTEDDLLELGYGSEMAQRILCLLEDRLALSRYVKRGLDQGCVPLTRVSEHYPLIVRKKLGLDAPGCLWAKGNLGILQMPGAALVGSREIYAPNRAFAEQIGARAARQGFCLVSGNAKGADQSAQNACLAEGGYVISVVADLLADKPLSDHVLYLSEDCFDEGFSAQRALSRNRIIHCLANLTFVAQNDLGHGGTWDGTARNLRNRWSPVFCYPDGSEGIQGLIQMGAIPVQPEQLSDFVSLQEFEQEIKMEEFL